MLGDDSDDDDDDDELVVDSIVAWLVRSLLPGGTRKPVRQMVDWTGLGPWRSGRKQAWRAEEHQANSDNRSVRSSGETSQPTQGLHSTFVRGPSVGNKATGKVMWLSNWMIKARVGRQLW